MTLLDITNSIFSFRGAAIAVALLSVVEVSKIKVNPWSWIGRKIGKVLNGEVMEKVETVETEVKSIRAEFDEDRAVTARVRILRFNDELLQNEKHSKDSFDQCLADIDAYEKYCHCHPKFKNNMTVMATENIKNCYKKCMDQHDFL